MAAPAGCRTCLQSRAPARMNAGGSRAAAVLHRLCPAGVPALQAFNAGHIERLGRDVSTMLLDKRSCCRSTAAEGMTTPLAWKAPKTSGADTSADAAARPASCTAMSSVVSSTYARLCKSECSMHRHL